MQYTHWLWVWKCVMKLPFAKCHSQAVGHRKRGHKTAFHKLCNVTHMLLVIGKDVIRLPFIKGAMSLTFCWSWERMSWGYLLQKVQCHSHAVMGKDIMRLPFTQGTMSCSLAVGHKQRCHETAFHKMCDVTHRLLVIGRNVMRLPFTKCATLLLTLCCSLEKLS